MKCHYSQPTLSILIPTYNYKIGLTRLLSFFDQLPKNKYEVIIYDNSPNEETEKYMNSWLLNHEELNITYKLNRPSTSPSINWNNLIENSKGKYCLLLHNGEVPENSEFFNNLITRLEKSIPDLALVNCILVNGKTRSAFFHLPFLIKTIVVKYFPEYLFQQNVIGPTSTLIIKKELYAKFDKKLKWLLDVDSYYRSLKVSKKIDFYNDLNILSISENTETLTAQLGMDRTKVELDERSYLFNKYQDIFWNEQSNSFRSSLIKLFEKITWKVIIKIYLICQVNMNKKLEKSFQKIWSIK